MKKDSVMFLFASIAIIAMGFGGYRYLTKKDMVVTSRDTGVEHTSSQLEDEFIEVPVFTFIEERDTNPAKAYAFDISYPTIALLGHPNHAKDTNSVIKTYTYDRLAIFQKNIDEIALEEGAIENTQGFTNDFTLRTTPTLIAPFMLSLRFDSAEYLAGAAHPSSQSSVLNYDIETQRIVTTGDLFASSSDALPFLSAFTRSVLTERFNAEGERDWDEVLRAGTAPLLGNFEAVAITKEGLLVIFNPYQVAAYARGTQEVLIPLADVAPLLAPRIIEAIRGSEANFAEAMPTDVEHQMEY